MQQLYPFPAVLGGDPDAPGGLDDMALALVLSAISPGIGGVLIRGEKGTAKSTLVRALAQVLPPIDVVAGDRFSSDPTEANPLSPDGPFPSDVAVETRPVRLVELPVGATEDRVVGSIHLERALSAGTVDFEPGLLARANRGILYVDEVNLLADHLVDLLLDAAAMGRLTVERDSVSVTHAARFVIVGTMNPEEGELRPQLLDRFGLTVEVSAPRDPALRAEAVRRRLAFDADPDGFTASYAAAQERLRARIRAAQKLLPQVALTDASLVKIGEICAAFDVDGLRGDIVCARTAVAHAAWQGRDAVTLEDLRVAARLALPHRRRRKPFDAPGLDDAELDELLPPEDSGPEPDPDGPGPDGPEPEGPPEGGNTTPTDQSGPPRSKPDSTSTVGADSPYRARLFSVDGVGEGRAGRRSRARTSSGRRVGATASGNTGGLHLFETLRAAAPHQGVRGRIGGRMILQANDLRRAVREGREANLVLFVVDTSGSMAAVERMRHVKTAILSLLLDAYRRRDRVAVVTFRDTKAELVLPATGSVEIAAVRLDELPAGGRTPLAEGLLEAAEVIRRERLREPACRPLLVVLTDGRATAGADPVQRSVLAADQLAGQGHSAVVVDCESGRMRLGLARTLAEHLRAEYVPLPQVSAEALTDVVRDATGRGAA
ncbi:magnesium chelatase subunit D family protein [[Mycobacterium] holstebronense]|uniref:Mg-protoporphyrin IX chelatase n=1 Tax=[Mycobacterium] holstebronense TaxID=3064288 RepID=A0ABM9M0T1_9MYCO|nr:magnesium chelatase subunit D family protein [Mycolicibacter sp. MU0102]CAJ1508131.1 magnesium chelatase subunit D family protein [Mycolicibacter sp. MU0102]